MVETLMELFMQMSKEGRTTMINLAEEILERRNENAEAEEEIQ